MFDFIPYGGISVPSIFFCLGLGLFVGMRGIKQPANLGFALGMASLAVSKWATFMSGISPDPVFWEKLSIAGQAVLAGSWLLFAMTFARKNPKAILKRWWPLLATSYLIPLGLLGFLGTPLFLMPSSGNPSLPYLPVKGVGYTFFLSYLLTLTISLMSIEQTFRSSSGSNRLQIKYMIIGTGTIFSLEIYRAGQVLLFSVIGIHLFPIHSTILMIANTVILFAVVRHRLLNVNIFVSRYVAYKSATLFAVGVYLATVGLMVIFVKGFVKESQTPLIPIGIFAALLGLVILLLSEGLSRRMRTFVNYHFYRNKHDYRVKWQELNTIVGSNLSLPVFLSALIEWLEKIMETKKVAVWLFDHEQKRYYLANRRGFSSLPTNWPVESQIIEALIARSAPFITHYSKSSFEEIVKEQPTFFEANPMMVWVPVFLGRKMIAMVVFGEKVSKTEYDYHDLELLMGISAHISCQIDRVQLIEELSVARELKGSHTLSSFFLEDLKEYATTLSNLAKTAETRLADSEFQEEAFKTIQETADKMNLLTSHINIVARGVVLSRSETDVNQLIETTVSGLNSALGLKRIYSILGDLPHVSIDQEKIANVFRNLILNACNAISEEGEVSIETRSEKSRLYISISDNGCGMSETFMTEKLFKPLRFTKNTGWGIGLFQCRQIIRAHGGRISVESKLGEGSSFIVELPADSLYG